MSLCFREIVMKKIKSAFAIAASVMLAFAYCGDKYSCKKGHGKKYFQHLDKDKDEKISKTEWETEFSEIDSDKDGYISQEEIREHHKKKHKRHHNKK